MSLIITNHTAPVLYQAHTSPQNRPEPGEIKDKVLDALADRQQQISTRIEDSVASRTEQLGQAKQFAEDQGHVLLSNLASMATERVNNTAQRIAEHVDRRFNTTEMIVEQRPDGGYQVSKEQGETLIGRLEARAEARTAAVDAISTAAGERLAELEAIVIENGYEGNRVADYADRVADRFQQTSERYDEYSEHRIGNMQNRLEQAYENIPESGLDDTEENVIVA